MPPLSNKKQIVPGTFIDAQTLNSVQYASVFTGEERNSPFSSEDYRLVWKISERDSLKDYELDSRPGMTCSRLGRLSTSGRVLGAELDSGGLKLNTLVGPPKPFLKSPQPSNSTYITVEEGEILTTTGDVISWPRQDVLLSYSTSGLTTVYIWVESDGIISVGSVLPALISKYTPLAKITLDTSGAIPLNSSGSVFHSGGFTDLRPNLYPSVVSAQNTELVNTTAYVSSDYDALAFDRILADTSGGSFIVKLPTNPRDNDRIAFIDINGTFSSQPLLVDPNSNTINLSADYLSLNQDYSVVTLVWSELSLSWYIEQFCCGSESSTDFRINHRTITSSSTLTSYTIDSTDYRYWISIDTTLATNFSLVLSNDLDPGFEVYVQKVGTGTLQINGTVLNSTGSVLSNNETILLTYAGGNTWKALKSGGGSTVAAFGDLTDVEDSINTTAQGIHTALGDNLKIVVPYYDESLLGWNASDIQIDFLSNVDTTSTVVSGPFLAKNTVSGEWQSCSATLSSLFDVNNTLVPSSGDFLSYDGTEWTNSQVSLSALADVSDTLSPTTGQTLVYNGTQWVSQTPAGGLLSVVRLTLTATYNISSSVSSSMWYSLDPGTANRNVILPATAPTGWNATVHNTTSSTFDLILRNNANTATLATLTPLNREARIVFDGVDFIITVI